MSKDISGLLTALTTPFAADGTIDDARLEWVVDRSVNAGVDAVVAAGGTGEFATLSDAERLHLIEVVVAHTDGRVPVVAQTGALTKSKAIELSRTAEAIGADCLMLSLPWYEPLTLPEITRYIEGVASSVDIPIMLYNNPFTTGVNMSVETIARFGREIDNVRYVKDSSKDWEQALRLIHHHSDDIGLIMGWDSFSFAAMLEGATGFMAGAANLVPDEIVAVVRSLRAGDVETARAQWNRVFPVIDALLDIPFSQGVKAGLALRGEPVGSPREPLLDIAAQDLVVLERALKALDAS